MIQKLTQGEKIRELFERFEIKGKDVARKLNVDTGLVSKWVNDKRVLRVDNDNMERLVDLVLSREISKEQWLWLKKTLCEDEIDSSFGSVSDYKLALMLWLADERDPSIRFIVDKIVSDDRSDVTSNKYHIKNKAAQRLSRSDFFCVGGANEIAIKLENTLKACAGGRVNIHITNENTSAIITSPIRDVLKSVMDDGKIKAKMLVSISNKGRKSSAILTEYLTDVLEDKIALYFENSDKPLVAEQTAIQLPFEGTVIISEVVDTNAPLIGTFITDESFNEGLKAEFENVLEFAAPAFLPLKDVSTRRVQRLYMDNYRTDGDVIVLRKSASLFYMSPDAYDRLLKKLGYKAEAFVWRSNMFKENRSALMEGLAGETNVYEMIPAECFYPIGQNRYKVDGDALMENGDVEVDGETLCDAIEGYKEAIRRFYNLHIRIIHESITPPARGVELFLKPADMRMIVKRNDEERPLIMSENQLFLKAVENMLGEFWHAIDEDNGAGYSSSYAERFLEGKSKDILSGMK